MPPLIRQEPIDFKTGITMDQAVAVAKKMGFSSAGTVKQAAENILNLYKLFISTDATMVEVNPFVETPEGNSPPSPVAD